MFIAQNDVSKEETFFFILALLLWICKFFQFEFSLVSHRSIFSGSSTASSDITKTSKESVKYTSQSGLSVIKITFPDGKKSPKKSSKTVGKN